MIVDIVLACMTPLDIEKDLILILPCLLILF